MSPLRTAMSASCFASAFGGTACAPPRSTVPWTSTFSSAGARVDDRPLDAVAAAGLRCGRRWPSGSLGRRSGCASRRPRRGPRPGCMATPRAGNGDALHGRRAGPWRCRANHGVSPPAFQPRISALPSKASILWPSSAWRQPRRGLARLVRETASWRARRSRTPARGSVPSPGRKPETRSSRTWSRP